MMRRHFVWAVVAIVALGPGIGSSARAAGPDVFTVPVDETSSFDACDFPVDVRTTGAIKVHDFFDQQDNLVREIANFNLKFTYTSRLTGDTVTSISAGPDKLTVNGDNSATVASIGILGRIVVPGQGLLAVQVGTIHLFFTDPGDDNPEVTFEAGRHDEAAAVDAAVCQALGG
jgi:hypothetical protein